MTEGVLPLVRDLVQHKNFANAAMLRAIAAHGPAAADGELLRQLHHILVANRFWLALFTGSAFDVAKEQIPPETLGAVASGYRDLSDRETRWMDGLRDADLERPVETPYLPGQSFSFAQALLQVCLHSHGHRAQCAARLRELGGNPPPTDFVVWLKERTAAQWVISDDVAE